MDDGSIGDFREVLFRIVDEFFAFEGFVAFDGGKNVDVTSGQSVGVVDDGD